MRRKPVRDPATAQYPRVRDLQPQRRRVLRWLSLGGAALAAGTLGCDRISDALGFGTPPISGPIHRNGDMPAPQPPQPPPPPPPAGGDDDSAEPSEATTESAGLGALIDESQLRVAGGMPSTGTPISGISGE